MILSGCSKNENITFNNELCENLSKDCETTFIKVPYFASYKIGLLNYVSICGYISGNNFNEKTNYYKIDYMVSLEDYEKLNKITENFEAIYPFKQEVYEQLNHIVNSYEPTSIKPATFKENSEAILDKIV